MLVGADLGAQVRPDPRSAANPSIRTDTLRRVPAVRDTTRRDTTARRDTGLVSSRARGDTGSTELVKFAELDSVMKALIDRTGYVATRYQGDTVYFDAQSKSLRLTGDPAAVQRERTMLVGDTVIYNDSTQVIQARGDSVILRDPEHNASDLVGGSIKYSIPGQRGVVTRLSTKIENSGQEWIVYGEHAAIVTGRDSVPPRAAAGDTIATADRHSAFYAREGSITSCDETEPHYHFQSKEIKVVTNGILVARPAVLYIGDVPVMWLPFIFQDLRKGRRSGILTPRFGLSELLRNSPSYRRTIDNFGYYFAISDYLDAALSLDWRSGAGGGTTNPGWTRVNGTLQYRWLDRFLDGRVGVSLHGQSDGSSTRQYSLAHRQDFSQRSHLTANLNYSTNTRVQRRSTIDPRAVVATIYSQLNYQQQLGKFNMSLGGSQRQYPGRTEIDRDFPSFNVSSQPIEFFGDFLTWTPTFSVSNTRRMNIDLPGEPGFSQIYRFVEKPDGTARLDSAQRLRDERSTALAIQTPLKIKDYTISLSARFNEDLRDYPGNFLVPDTSKTGTDTTRRIYSRSFIGRFDWDVGFSLPPFLQGSWNLVPSVALVNVDGGPFFVRSQFSNGAWVAQSKRPVYSVSASPTFYGLFPGIGPVRRLRHSIAPNLSYNYAAAADVSNEYLLAAGIRRAGYLGSLAQSRLSVGLATNIEAKVSGAAADTLAESGRKVRLISLTFTPLGYDFERLKELKKRKGGAIWSQGLTTDRVGYTLKSDLLPGIDIGVNYSLFQGNVQSDTAEFSPYREDVRGSFSLNRNSAIFAPLYRLLGFRARGEAEAGATSPANAPQPTQGTQARGPNAAATDYNNIGGRGTGADIDRIRNQQLPTGQGWQASFTLSSARQRPVRGGTQVSSGSTAQCELLRNYPPPAYDECLRNPAAVGGVGTPVTTTPGGAVFSPPPVTSISSQLGFNLTPKWTTQWQTSYDFEAGEFASHIVSLQRDLHDWRATFSFTQAPNGAVSFSFFIALKSEPDIKFDYRKATYPGR